LKPAASVLPAEVTHVYDEILVPTDGSEASAGALDHAIELARTYDARLHVLYVVEPVYTADYDARTIADAMEAEGTETTTELAERAEAAGVEATGAVEFGTPHRKILECADERGVDLIVMATHGRTGLDRYLLGSVTEKVVRTAEIPVLTVRTREAAAEASDTDAVPDDATDADGE
jgi:nucleotide-binding universal stress UspA family protein